MTHPRSAPRGRTLWTLAALVAAACPAQADLRAELEARLAQAGKTSFSIQVVDLSGGELLYAHDAERRLTPASNMKLLTTAAALSLLGPDYAHETRLVLSATPAQGVVDGHLIVIGGGDPTWSRRFDDEPLLADWARSLAAKGVTRIAGDLIVDDRAFSDARLHPTWESSDPENWYGAEVAALNLNDNCVDVRVGGGEQVTVASTPDTRYVAFDVRAQLIPTQKGHSFSLVRTGDDKRTIRVNGKVWRKASPYESSVPVRDPALFFGAVLREQLAAAGVTLGGQVRRPEPAETLDGLTVELRRAPLPRTLETTNQHSLNLYAECLFKTLGKERGAAGSWSEGSRVIGGWLQGLGVAADDLKILDGSGLSRDNELTARALVTVLRAMHAGPHAALYKQSLATPGGKGTLSRRLKDLPQGVELRAKTGTLRGVSALAGYLRRGERELAFAAIGNGGSGGQIRRTLDAVVRILCGQLE